MPISKHSKGKRTHKQWLKAKNIRIAQVRYSDSPKRDRKEDRR
jgi:hypothetical protein